VGQLGLLLKGDERTKLIPECDRPVLFLQGFSQSAQYIRTWLAAFHDLVRTPVGQPLYDGYLAIAGPVMARINQCSADVEAEDPRQKLAITDARFISLSSEGEMWLARHSRQPDRVSSTSGIVSY